MPPDAESRDPSEWFRKGQQDLDRVPRRLKGFLIGRGWSVQRTHNLTFLLDEATKHQPELSQYRRLCHEASAFYVEERYPISTQAPSLSDLEQLLALARQLIALLR